MKWLPNFLFGAIAGAVIITMLGFTNNWIVTAEKNQQQVSDAFIDAQAQVCQALAQEHLRETPEKEKLAGYQSDVRELRDQLANEFAVALPGDKTPDALVITSCAQKLNPDAG